MGLVHIPVLLLFSCYKFNMAQKIDKQLMAKVVRVRFSRNRENQYLEVNILDLHSFTDTTFYNLSQSNVPKSVSYGYKVLFEYRYPKINVCLSNELFSSKIIFNYINLSSRNSIFRLIIQSPQSLETLSASENYNYCDSLLPF